MAHSYQQGYDDRRFEGRVREDLICSICQGVLRNPRTCQNKEHPFCLSCISQHLRNSHICPECREHLTPETLKDPPRFLKNTLSGLKIKCDYNERGCPGYVQLGNLQHHVERCGFAPVMCGNEGCGTVVNKRDKEIHERELCQCRIPKCHDCRDIKASQDEMKASHNAIKENVDEMKVRQDEMIASQIGMERKQDEIKEHVDEMKVELSTTKVQNTEMERKQDEINVKVNQVKENVDEIKRTQAEMKADQVMFKAEVSQQFQRMAEMLNQLLQGSNVSNNGAQAVDPAFPDNNQDIIILGGRCSDKKDGVLNTAEKFNIVEGKSTQLPRMNLARAELASCVYNSDVIVTGGHDGQAGTDLIEVLKMNQHALRWTMFDGKLPVKLSAHDVTVYQEKLYIIGGFNWNEKKTSDAIYELSLAPPYTVKLLARMPQPRRDHRAEIVNGKLFILGGSTTNKSNDTTDSVVVYDFIKNEIKPCPSLSKPVSGMSTVTWGNMIIVVGGLDKNDQALNDVIMYHIESGRSERLPSLKHKRFGASAVIMHDVIVVLGGGNKEEGHLNSVESFTMGDDQWKELPGMKEKRVWATAVVKPGN
ncbi:E3 ubiquitin- ligase NRDP1-like [Paramuricea clavata]|uniref:E3 ubiquitin- ligase NRDP1-like n=1 Tax=Paramuricea clavata TaxID=317549 RepID=A0A6S7G3Y1_PARCT|nr:E3 ubiquitin- ligase NRDP1-like [Paramuricea clavata]